MNASLRQPPALRAGARIGVLGVSSPSNLDRLEAGYDSLRFAGFEPVEFPTARGRATQFSWLVGTDAERAADLRKALLDSDIDAIFLVSGGYGSQRTLEALDWSGLEATTPKLVVGYSDVTGLLEAVASRLGWSSIMGPMVSEHEFAESYSFNSLIRLATGTHPELVLQFPDAHTVTPGRADGITCGGNLSLLAGSVGTDTAWVPDQGIWLLEDETESPERIDTMLTHLRRAGYFDDAAGIICGTWHDSGDEDVLSRVVRDRLGSLGIPTIDGANIGHGGHVQSYPIGVAATLDADARTLTLE
ncbi:muramoyltetrapeptide carboxypeptidase [Branchiibius hedensis]|uniref:Muramoyltetrapeptide carboxypeptidase n=1 Tax=Branchiibius hedensis TaxID=672460 RepID=A0A2Y8ZQK2_9MICO|nr:LD-carboxypeptidase [Branchiibius hedensis]PWJ25827.1 muramoyltetrapeptide carboxypeptidase [Branchiibius hedensis]SSA34640.1 muramoyltetrapeptide carboxypeptidase [Branchiibius hedensis]